MLQNYATAIVMTKSLAARAESMYSSHLQLFAYYFFHYKYNYVYIYIYNWLSEIDLAIHWLNSASKYGLCLNVATHSWLFSPSWLGMLRGTTVDPMTELHRFWQGHQVALAWSTRTSHTQSYPKESQRSPPHLYSSPGSATQKIHIEALNGKPWPHRTIPRCGEIPMAFSALSV